MPIRVPTREEYLAYTGAHCHQLWASLGEEWRCPGCCRAKYEIMRWTTRYAKCQDGSKTSYKGWMAGLHKHHDHSQGYWDSAQGRFPQMIVCDQCNAADGAAKRKLRLPKNFSFSPWEIRQFTTCTPHGKHKLNFEIAGYIYAQLTHSKFPC